MKSKRRTQISVTILPDVLAVADAKAAEERLTRSRWIERQIEQVKDRRK